MGTTTYVALLGLPPSDPKGLLKRVRDGLAFRSLEQFRKNAGFEKDEIGTLVAITPRTLHRRKLQGRLDPQESDRLVRVARVFAQAIELFEGDRAAALQWFQAPARALGGERPINLAGTDVGSREVETLINRLEHGVLT